MNPCNRNQRWAIYHCRERPRWPSKDQLAGQSGRGPYCINREKLAIPFSHLHTYTYHHTQRWIISHLVGFKLAPAYLALYLAFLNRKGGPLIKAGS